MNEMYREKHHLIGEQEQRPACCLHSVSNCFPGIKSDSTWSISLYDILCFFTKINAGVFFSSGTGTISGFAINSADPRDGEFVNYNMATIL
jgi:hypothetical protein